MQFDNQKTRNVADVVARILAGESAEQEPKMLEEELKGDQHKIDANKNNKIDAHDFKLLRAKKKMKEETELTESHFKVGDEVICKASGMEGEVVKVDPKEEGKYYTVKREDGKMVKYAPNELKKEEEDEKEDEDKKEMKESAGASKAQETKFHTSLDNLVHKTFGASPSEKKEKMKKEEVELDESMFPGTKEYEKKYGQSPQQKLKKKGDTVPTSQGEMTKTDKGIAHRRKFTEMLETYKEGGLKTIAEMMVTEEPDNEQFTKEVEEVKKKATEKKSPEDEARVAKAKVDAVKVEEEVEQIDELSKSTLASYAKKASREARMKHGIGKDFERISKSSRKPEYKAGAKEWEDKYKSDARRREAGVGKAIDRLAKEEVEQIDEISQKLATAAYAKRTSTMSHNDPVARKKEDAAYERIGKRWGQKGQQKADAAADKYQAEEVELDEREMTDAEMKKREKIVKSMKKGLSGFKQRYGDRAKEVMYATATKQAMKD